MHSDMTVGTAFSTNHQDLGYSFDDPCVSQFTCYHQLNVWLRALPTERHYDPEHVQCHVSSAGKAYDTISIHHPWPQLGGYRVCPGEIVLNDRKNRRIEAYTFGGELTICREPALTACHFESPAPIIPLSSRDHLSTLFVAEIGGLLAEEQARWNVQRRAGDFNERLCAVPPFDLYVACLLSVDAHLREIRPRGYMPERQILYIAGREQRRLQDAGAWPSNVATLTEILDHGA